jgi:hypothetical protein
MSPLERKRPGEEEGDRGGSMGLSFELDSRTCPRCRREFPAWVRECPADGMPTVPVEELEPEQDPLLARFLEDEDADEDAEDDPDPRP